MGKIGEVYRVNDLKPARYFQLVALDLTQLNSDVIAVFSSNNDLTDSTDEIDAIVHSGVEFFTHTTVSAGVSNKLWTKIGKTVVVNCDDALFKDIDYNDDFPDWEPYEKDYYHSWVIWRPNEEWRKIGDRLADYPNAELGAVYPPNDVVYRIEHGKYPGVPYYGQVR